VSRDPFAACTPHAVEGLQVISRPEIGTSRAAEIPAIDAPEMRNAFRREIFIKDTSHQLSLHRSVVTQLGIPTVIFEARKP